MVLYLLLTGNTQMEIEVTHLKIINIINHNSKNKNRKIDYSFGSATFSTVGIFHVNMATSEGRGGGGLHVFNWDRVKMSFVILQT